MILQPESGKSYEEVPDTVVPIPAGIYTTIIRDAEVKENNNKDGFNLVVSHEVFSEGEAKGRKLTQYISTKMDTQIKRLAKSCGVAFEPNGGLDITKLKDKLCRVVVSTRVYEDKTTKQQKETSNIQEILIPGDAAFEG